MKRPLVRRNIYIDFLKGLAILGVLAFHLTFDLSSIDYFFINYADVIDSGQHMWIARMYNFLKVTIYSHDMKIVVILFASLFCFLGRHRLVLQLLWYESILTDAV